MSILEALGKYRFGQAGSGIYHKELWDIYGNQAFDKSEVISLDFR